MGSIRKLLYASLGLVDLTREKAEILVADLVERGEMTGEEGKDFLAKLFEKADTEKQEMVHRFHKESQRVMAGMGVASKEEVQELRLRLEKLENQLRQGDGEKGETESKAGEAGNTEV